MKHIWTKNIYIYIWTPHVSYVFGAKTASFRLRFSQSSSPGAKHMSAVASGLNRSGEVCVAAVTRRGMTGTTGISGIWCKTAVEPWWKLLEIPDVEMVKALEICWAHWAVILWHSYGTDVGRWFTSEKSFSWRFKVARGQSCHLCWFPSCWLNPRPILLLGL